MHGTHIHRNHLVLCGWIKSVAGSINAKARIIDQQFYVTIALCPLKDARCRVILGKVQRQGFDLDLRIVSAKRLNRTCKLRLIQTDPQKPPAALGQATREGQPDTAGAAGNERRSAHGALSKPGPGPGKV